MTIVDGELNGGVFSRVPVVLRAIVTGLLIGLLAANVWPLLLVALGMPRAALAEAGFLVLYVWWVSGSGLPSSTMAAHRLAFRRGSLTGAQWAWGIVAALSFAICVHAAMVVLFRLVPFPVASFRRGYDFGAVSSLPLKWLAIVVSAASAGICEETGFRGYMQQPIEKRHGASAAILISSLLFMLLHLNKGWATLGMVPIVFGAGVLLGLIAWASGSLIPGMIGHTVMDVGLFAYWWTGIAGTFSAKTIDATGADLPFEIACAIFCVSLIVTLAATFNLRHLTVRLAE